MTIRSIHMYTCTYRLSFEPALISSFTEFFLDSLIPYASRYQADNATKADMICILNCDVVNKLNRT